MLEVIISFSYELTICLMFGFLITELTKKIVPLRDNFFSVLITGAVSITVLVGFISIFTGIGAIVTCFVIIASIAGTLVFKSEFLVFARRIKGYFLTHKWEMVFYLFIAIAIAYFTSRGIFHTDTNLYHAANIRIYEETGLVRGMGNIYWNYAYNSMYHAFCAFFSEHWILAKPWHTTSGFLGFIFSAYAIHNLKTLNARRIRVSDAGSFAILIYVLNILYYINSPATDFAAMLFSLYLMTEWLRVRENADKVSDYAILSVLSVFIVTLKLSAGPLVFAAIYPAFMLIKEKRVKEILRYLGLGIFVSLPYFVRNYLISGWLAYPFKSIDLFDVQWKMPVDFLDMDVSIITGSGKCLFDMPADLPIRQWVPIWWGAQEYYGKLLFIAAVFAGFILVAHEIHSSVQGKFDFQVTALLVGVFASFLLWFVQAPFIRYGLAFLLFLPCMAVTEYFSEMRCGFRRIVMGISAIIIIFFVTPFVDHYIGDNIGFISMHMTEPYYIWQKDYDETEIKDIRIGNVIINGTCGAVNSYYAYPSVSGVAVDSRVRAYGDSFEEGFYMEQ